MKIPKIQGVFVRGLEMPSCCDQCLFLDDSSDYPICRATGESRGYTFNIREKRMDWCPLEPMSPQGYRFSCSKCGNTYYADSPCKYDEDFCFYYWVATCPFCGVKNERTSTSLFK